MSFILYTKLELEMPKNKGKKANNNAQNVSGNLKGGLARTRRSERPAIGPNISSGTMRKINSRLSWPADDCVTLHVRYTKSTTNTGNPVGGQSLALDPTNIVAAGYSSLGASSPIVLAMSGAYSRFMVTKCMVKATLTTPITNGGFVGLGYTPDNSTVSGPPASLIDATSAVHSDMAQVGESAIIKFDASDYFVDWRPTKASSAVAAPDNQCGVIQIYGDAGSSEDSKKIIEVDCIIHFAGYRYNP